MIIRDDLQLIANAFHIQIGLDTLRPDALSPEEAAAIARFGEPVVECGGAFSVGSTYTLAANQRRFPSQFPVKQVFGIADEASVAAANAKAVTFRTEIRTRIDAALTALRALNPGTLGGNSTTIATND